ncbi:synaptotagmin-2-like isoform X2 [Syzygium oleosum]|uniref:synaptotagmin-2-like isoform X2 n=1 Tax=Syzygium oleosum TaxID=219896 RepID=UPI0024BB6E4E|nr:synaptotagmin-2-like isoform X2 [Syzygium oleosum]
MITFSCLVVIHLLKWHIFNAMLLCSPGMKVCLTDEKELIMELSMKWAGNPNIIVAAKAFGLRATVQPLVPTFPCFAKIFVSLMEKPHVDFGLKLLGADAMSIPGLYRFVQELIKIKLQICTSGLST